MAKLAAFESFLLQGWGWRILASKPAPFAEKKNVKDAHPREFNVMHEKLRNEKVSAELTSCRYIWFFALLLLPCIDTACFGQTVKIRIVNATNESPAKSHTVSISGISGNGDTEAEEKRKLLTKPTTPDLRLVTDANGEVQFELPKPAPAYFFVRPELSAPVWDCTCLLRVSTEELMQKGLVTRNAYAGGNPSIQSKPGEILFRLKPLPLWARVLWPLLTR